MVAATHPHRHWELDRLAMGLSGLCAIHCVSSAVLLGLASALGGALLNPLYHEVGLTLAIVLGAVALGRGLRRHGYVMPMWVGSLGLGIMAGALSLPEDGSGAETIWTVIGVGILALGHDLNRRATY